MPKGFSEKERDIINAKLITACEEYWNLYGYQKISVMDICSKCGISSGAYYLFYESKELLFFETAKRSVKCLLSIIDQNMPPNKPAKQDFAKTIKIMAKEIENTKWLLPIEDDYEIFKRRLPAEILNEFVDIYSFQAEKYQFSSKVPPQTAKFVLAILITIGLHKKTNSKHYNMAYEFIIDSVIDRLFE